MNFLPVDVEGGQEEGKGQEVCNGASLCVTSKARSLHLSLLVSPLVAGFKDSFRKQDPKPNDVPGVRFFSHSQGATAHSNLELVSCV